MQWINLNEIRGINDESLVLFGAGKGTEEFIEFLTACRLEARVVAIADNNPSLQDKTLNGLPIICPEAIPELDFDKIVVTSISGRDAIARQLRQMGYKETEDFLLVGRYPDSWQRNLNILREVADVGIALRDKTCLTVGPGGFLGLEVLLFCMGAARVCAVDKNAFGIHYPDITPREKDYMKIREILPLLAPAKGNTGDAQNRFDSLYIRKSNRLYLDSDRIKYHYPMDVSKLEFPDEAFDIILSFAVLEHVQDPHQTIAEMRRVLKPSGCAIHRIVTQDHRSFAGIQEFDPFSFRRHSSREWERISSKTFFQNRLLPVEWKRLFRQMQHKILIYRVHDEFPLDDTAIDRFHMDFHRFSRKELSEIDCTIFSEKPS